jgi:hypothetical protein
MSSNALSEAEIAVLRRAADLLIPRVGDRAAASELGVHREGARRVLAVRPELGPVVRPVLAEGARFADVGELRAAAGEAFAALCELVAGAYFTVPSVLDGVGYPGRPPRELGDLERLRDDLEVLTAPLRHSGRVGVSPDWDDDEAEGEGFEPSVRRSRTTVFETAPWLPGTGLDKPD